MALSGLHVVCAQTAGQPARASRVELLGKLHWSETPADGVVTTNAAPELREAVPVFELYSTVDAYVSVGPSPNAAASPRLFLPAGTLVDLLVDPGDKLAWTAA